MTKPAKNKEQTILEAAEREFLNKGFAGARTTSIAEAAGVTHAMLHYYFRTKEQLFERILDEKMRLMSQSVLTAFGQPGLPLAERLRNGVERHFDFIAATPDTQRTSVRMSASDRRITSLRNSSSDTINIRCMGVMPALPAGNGAPKIVPERRADKKNCRTCCL